MSKLNADIVTKAVDDILAYSKGEKIILAGKEVNGKKRKFLESIELQITLKNYDPQRDKRFSGTFVLPLAPKPKLSVCILGNQVHCEEAGRLGIDFKTMDDLKAFNKNKKLMKVFLKSYDALIASDNLIAQVTRLLGRGLAKAGKVPSVLNSNDNMQDKIEQLRRTIKFQMKSVMCMNSAIGHVNMTKEQIILNIQLASNFLASLLKKNWQNIKVIYVKSTMGPAYQIHF
jgi:large subunit ribosomal protein L10Ae